MFREVARVKKRLPREECIEVLKTEPRGVLSVLGDEGYPYGVPMDHWYCEEDGHLYFHSGKQGHKIDAIRQCNKVSFCVYDAGYRQPDEWALNIRSVIVFGRIRVVEDAARAVEITRQLSYKYTDDTVYIEEEIRQYSEGLLVFELIPEHITGKLVKES